MVVPAGLGIPPAQRPGFFAPATPGGTALVMWPANPPYHQVLTGSVFQTKVDCIDTTFLAPRLVVPNSPGRFFARVTRAAVWGTRLKKVGVEVTAGIRRWGTARPSGTLNALRRGVAVLCQV